MHELQYTEYLLEKVLAHAEANRAKKIVSIHLEVGVLRDFMEDWLQRYFDHLSKNTLAEGAQLQIEKIPIMLQCENCNNTFRVDKQIDRDFLCPKCNRTQCVLIKGSEYRITHLVVL